eukprot:SAG11_NODE_16370_length_549_cov_1.417778_1_plen_103_part_10
MPSSAFALSAVLCLRSAVHVLGGLLTDVDGGCWGECEAGSGDNNGACGDEFFTSAWGCGDIRKQEIRDLRPNTVDAVECVTMPYLPGAAEFGHGDPFAEDYEY